MTLLALREQLEYSLNSRDNDSHFRPQGSGLYECCTERQKDEGAVSEPEERCKVIENPSGPLWTLLLFIMNYIITPTCWCVTFASLLF